jgi:hypothetical protein
MRFLVFICLPLCETLNLVIVWSNCNDKRPAEGGHDLSL